MIVRYLGLLVLLTLTQAFTLPIQDGNDSSLTQIVFKRNTIMPFALPSENILDAGVSSQPSDSTATIENNTQPIPDPTATQPESTPPADLNSQSDSNLSLETPSEAQPSDTIPSPIPENIPTDSVPVSDSTAIEDPVSSDESLNSQPDIPNSAPIDTSSTIDPNATRPLSQQPNDEPQAIPDNQTPNLPDNQNPTIPDDQTPTIPGDSQPDTSNTPSTTDVPDNSRIQKRLIQIENTVIPSNITKIDALIPIDATFISNSTRPPKTSYFVPLHKRTFQISQMSQVNIRKRDECQPPTPNIYDSQPVTSAEPLNGQAQNKSECEPLSSSFLIIMLLVYLVKI